MKLFFAFAMAWALLAEQSIDELHLHDEDQVPNAWQALANASAPGASSALANASAPWQALANAQDDTIDIDNFSDVPDTSAWAELAAESAEAEADGAQVAEAAEDIDQDIDSSAIPSPTENGSLLGSDHDDHDPDDPEAFQLQVQPSVCGVCCESTIKQVILDNCTTQSKTPLHDTIWRHITDLSSSISSEQGNCISRLAHELLQNPKHRHQNNSELADKHEIDRTLLPKHMQTLASAFIEVERAQRRGLEEQYVETYPEPDLMTFIDLGTYDESPMPVVTVDFPDQDERQQIANSTSSQLVSSTGVLAMPNINASLQSQSKNKTCTKKIQSEQKHVALIRLHDPDTYVVVCGTTTNWLQRLQNTGTLAITAALQRTSAVSEFANSFKHCWRSTCTDDAKANPAAEAKVLEGRNLTKKCWKGWRKACEVHKAATCHKVAFLLMEFTISGVLNASLSVNFGNYIGRFRRHTYDVIKAILIFRTTPLDQAAKTYKMHILRIFCASGRRRSFKVTCLLRLLPGDWRNTSAVEYILQPGESAADAREHVARGVSTALCSAKFFEYPRHRWTGADISVSQWGLMEAVHGLASRTYPLFKASFGRGTDSTPSSTRDHVEPTVSAEADAGAADDGGAGAPLPIQAPAAEDQVGPQDLPQAASANISAEDNERFRSKALVWVQSSPLGQLLIMRLCMEPLCVLLQWKLYIGSQLWELFQKATAAAQEMDPASSTWPNREFAIGVASKNVIEDKCMARLGDLLNPSMWVAMPGDSLTEACQATCFMVMSRVGCMVEELLRQRHRLAPWITVAILWDPDAAARILEMPRCLLDELTCDLIDAGDFGGMESRMKMFALALADQCDISNLEALHAWVRRHLLNRAQTHGWNFEELGALWVFGRNRSSLRRAETHEPEILKRPAGQSPDEPCTKKPKNENHTNSYNLFCRRFVASTVNPGQRKDWSAAGEAWRNLPQEEKDKLKLETKAAKARAETFGLNGSIFGMKASRLAAKASKAVEAQNESLSGHILPSSSSSQNASAFGKEQLRADSASLEGLHRKAMQLERKSWGLKQAEERKAKKLISKWLANQSSIKVGLILSYSEAALVAKELTIRMAGKTKHTERGDAPLGCKVSQPTHLAFLMVLPCALWNCLNLA